MIISGIFRSQNIIQWRRGVMEMFVLVKPRRQEWEAAHGDVRTEESRAASVRRRLLFICRGLGQGETNTVAASQLNPTYQKSWSTGSNIVQNWYLYQFNRDVDLLPCRSRDACGHSARRLAEFSSATVNGRALNEARDEITKRFFVVFNVEFIKPLFI